MSEFLQSESIFRPQFKGLRDFERETASLSLLRLPRSLTGITRREQLVERVDRGSGSATIFTLYFACFHAVERAREASGAIVFALFLLLAGVRRLVTARNIP